MDALAPPYTVAALSNPLAIMWLCVRAVYLFCSPLSSGLAPACGPPGIPRYFPILSPSSGVRFWWMPLTLGRPPRSPSLSLPTKFIRRCQTVPRDVWCGAQGECLSLSPLAGRHQEGRRKTWRVLQTVGTGLKSSWVPTKITQGNFHWKSTWNSWGGRSLRMLIGGNTRTVHHQCKSVCCHIPVSFIYNNFSLFVFWSFGKLGFYPAIVIGNKSSWKRW